MGLATYGVGTCLALQCIVYYHQDLNGMFLIVRLRAILVSLFRSKI